MQIWTANDFDHRLVSDKLRNILELAKKSLEFGDWEVEVEYGFDVVSQYKIKSHILQL